MVHWKPFLDFLCGTGKDEFMTYDLDSSKKDLRKNETHDITRVRGKFIL